MDETGSAEYGVEHLGTPLLVVLGHTGCGAVTAAVTHAEVRGSIPPLLAHIKPAVRTAREGRPELTGSDLIPEAIHANVFHSIEELFKRSETIRSRVRAGKLKVVGAIYDLKSGRVNWLGVHPKQPALAARHKYSSFQMHATRFAFAMKKRKNGTNGNNGTTGPYNGWLRVFRFFRLFRFSSSDAGDQVA
ncbi:MAG: carbonic anhydrase [Blastocatellia bacterium]|nr:carbonic anhydrase [Blastocatellia bacterium]